MIPNTRQLSFLSAIKNTYSGSHLNRHGYKNIEHVSESRKSSTCVGSDMQQQEHQTNPMLLLGLNRVLSKADLISYHGIDLSWVLRPLLLYLVLDMLGCAVDVEGAQLCQPQIEACRYHARHVPKNCKPLHCDLAFRVPSHCSSVKLKANTSCDSQA